MLFLQVLRKIPILDRSIENIRRPFLGMGMVVFG